MRMKNEIFYRVPVQFCFSLVWLPLFYKTKKKAHCGYLNDSLDVFHWLDLIRQAFQLAERFFRVQAVLCYEPALCMVCMVTLLISLCKGGFHTRATLFWLLAGRHWRASTTTTSAGTVQPPRATAPCSQPALRFFPIGH